MGINKHVCSYNQRTCSFWEGDAMKVHRGRGCVFSLCYHVVFCVKYRHRVLTGPVVQRLGKILHQQAETNGFQIPSMQVMPDHVHLLLMCRPQHTIPELLRQLKGTSVRLLFQEFPQLRGKLWGGHFVESLVLRVYCRSTDGRCGQNIHPISAGSGL